MARLKLKTQWVVVVDGLPVTATNASTRSAAIYGFCCDDEWDHYRDLGYDVVRVNLVEMARRGPARLGKARQGRAMRGLARPGKARQGKARQGKRI